MAAEAKAQGDDVSQTGDHLANPPERMGVSLGVPRAGLFRQDIRDDLGHRPDMALQVGGAAPEPDPGQQQRPRDDGAHRNAGDERLV